MALNTDNVTAEKILGGDDSHTLFNTSLPRAIANIAQHIRDLWNHTNLDSIYPIGSVYMCLTQNMRNPSNIFGGEWEMIPDRFLVGAGGSYDAGEAGGEASTDFAFVSLQHRHSFDYYLPSEASSISRMSGNTNDDLTAFYGAASETYTRPNLPPYLAVYIWVRVG